jgi:hypothetical protein
MSTSRLNLDKDCEIYYNIILLQIIQIEKAIACPERILALLSIRQIFGKGLFQRESGIISKKGGCPEDFLEKLG